MILSRKPRIAIHLLIGEQFPKSLLQRRRRAFGGRLRELVDFKVTSINAGKSCVTFVTKGVAAEEVHWEKK